MFVCLLDYCKNKYIVHFTTLITASDRISKKLMTHHQVTHRTSYTETDFYLS